MATTRERYHTLANELKFADLAARDAGPQLTRVLTHLHREITKDSVNANRASTARVQALLIGAVTNLAASVSRGIVSVTWTDPENLAEAVDCFALQYSNSSDFSSPETLLLGKVNHWEKLLDTGAYYFRVAARSVNATNANDDANLTAFYSSGWGPWQPYGAPTAIDVYSGWFALTYSSTVNTDASLGKQFSLAATAAFTLANPTNVPYHGYPIAWKIKQPSSGGAVITLGSKFRLGSDISSVVLSAVANAVDYIGVFYDSGDDKFDVVSFVKGYV